MRDIYQTLPLIHVFRVVAENGSFQSAANILGMTRSSVSKKIQQLESSLDQAVFVRSTRKLLLTDFGKALLDGSQSMAQLLEQVDKVADDGQSSPTGTVRISTSVLLGQHYLIPLLAGIKQSFPNILLDISFNDETVDFYKQGVDIAIRVGNLPDSSLIAKKVGEKTWGWFTSPRYIANHGIPQKPESLASHSCLACQNKTLSQSHWLFKQADGVTTTVKISPSIVTDSSRALVDMAVAGLGIVMLDALTIQNELKLGKLKPIFQHWHHPDTVPIHLLSLSPSQRSRAANCVWRYLSDRLVIKPL